MGAVHVVVSCTKRKTRRPLAGLDAAELSPLTNVEDRAGEWLRRLADRREGLIPASELYCGDHWKVALGLPHISASPVRLWVCSAGYGLLTPSSLVAPYDATFSPAAPSRVVDDPAQRPAWWSALARWAGPSGDGPRSLAALAATHPCDCLILAMSKDYLAALGPDLLAATRILGPSRVGVVCAGAKELPALPECLLPCDARLRPLVGGALASLNVRVVRHLLATARGKSFTIAACRRSFSKWLAEAEPTPHAARSHQDDEQISAFLRAALAEDPEASATPLLRRLRGQGKACEHTRFTRLFHQARGR